MVSFGAQYMQIIWINLHSTCPTQFMHFEKRICYKLLFFLCFTWMPSIVHCYHICFDPCYSVLMSLVFENSCVFSIWIVCLSIWIFVIPANYIKCNISILIARRGGVEVADWTFDRKIRVRFPAYPHPVGALWWQGGKRRLRTSRCPCRGRLGTLKTPICPWHWVPSSRSKFGNWTTVLSLYSWNIAEFDVKTTTIHQFSY